MRSGAQAASGKGAGTAIESAKLVEPGLIGISGVAPVPEGLSPPVGTPGEGWGEGWGASVWAPAPTAASPNTDRERETDRHSDRAARLRAAVTSVL